MHLRLLFGKQNEQVKEAIAILNDRLMNSLKKFSSKHKGQAMSIE